MKKPRFTFSLVVTAFTLALMLAIAGLHWWVGYRDVLPAPLPWPDERQRHVELKMLTFTAKPITVDIYTQ